MLRKPPEIATALALVAAVCCSSADARPATLRTVTGENGASLSFAGQRANGDFSRLLYTQHASDAPVQLLTSREGSSFSAPRDQSRAVSPDRAVFFVAMGDADQASQGQCVFIEAKSGCVVSQASGEACDGSWAASHAWKAADGQDLSVDDDRPTIAGKLADLAKLKGAVNLGAMLQDDPIDNMLRCDPPIGPSRAAYQQALGKLQPSDPSYKTLKAALAGK